MTTVIDLPGPGVVGPGIPINLRSDFIGPLSQDASWHLIVYTGLNLEFRYVEMVVKAFTVQQPVWLWSDPQQSIVATSTAQPAAGDNIRIVAELHESSGIVDTGSTTAPWNPTLGLGLQAVLRPTTGTGGFTAQDRADLQATKAGVIVDLSDHSVPNPANGIPLSRLPGALPVVWGRRTGPYLLTGRGVLDLPAVVGATVYVGMRWFYTVVPADWGMTPGAIDEFEGRPAQLVPIMRLDSGEEVGNPIMDTNTSGGFYAFDVGFFSGKIAYDVGPGVQVSLFIYVFP